MERQLIRLVKAKTLARMLGFSIRKLYRLIEKGEIKGKVMLTPTIPRWDLRDIEGIEMQPEEAMLCSNKRLEFLFEISSATRKRMIAGGYLPKQLSLMPGRAKRWDIQDLTRHIDKLKQEQEINV